MGWVTNDPTDALPTCFAPPNSSITYIHSFWIMKTKEIRENLTQVGRRMSKTSIITWKKIVDRWSTSSKSMKVLKIYKRLAQKGRFCGLWNESPWRKWSSQRRKKKVKGQPSVPWWTLGVCAHVASMASAPCVEACWCTAPSHTHVDGRQLYNFQLCSRASMLDTPLTCVYHKYTGYRSNKIV